MFFEKKRGNKIAVILRISTKVLLKWINNKFIKFIFLWSSQKPANMKPIPDSARFFEHRVAKWYVAKIANSNIILNKIIPWRNRHDAERTREEGRQRKNEANSFTTIEMLTKRLHHRQTHTNGYVVVLCVINSNDRVISGQWSLIAVTFSVRLMHN